MILEIFSRILIFSKKNMRTPTITNNQLLGHNSILKKNPIIIVPLYKQIQQFLPMAYNI